MNMGFEVLHQEKLSIEKNSVTFRTFIKNIPSMSLVRKFNNQHSTVVMLTPKKLLRYLQHTADKPCSIFFFVQLKKQRLFVCKSSIQSTLHQHTSMYVSSSKSFLRLKTVKKKQQRRIGKLRMVFIFRAFLV